MSTDQEVTLEIVRHGTRHFLMTYRGQPQHLDRLCNHIASVTQGHERFGHFSTLRHNGGKLFSILFKTTHELVEFNTFLNGTIAAKALPSTPAIESDECGPAE